MTPDQEEVKIPPLSDTTLVEKIDKKGLKPLYDLNHEHNYVADGDETDDYKAEICDVKNCNLGRLIAKT